MNSPAAESAKSKFYTEVGCCSSSLRLTCIYIGCICAVLGFLQIAGGFFWSTSYIMIISNFVFTVGSLCLVVGVIIRKPMVMVPWFVGYLFTVMAFLTVFLGHFLGWLSAEDECQPSFFQFLYRILVCFIKLVVETVLFRYVFSYYDQLEQEKEAANRPGA